MSTIYGEGFVVDMPRNEATRRRLLERGPDGKPSFVYIPAGETDLHALFKRIAAQMRPAEQPANVRQLKNGAKP